MKRTVLFLLLFAPTSWPQASTGNAHTSGSCSPAVTGNNNTFTITCQGVPKEKADQMVRLMNEILSRQLDPKQVYSQLNKIRSDIDDLGVALNPLASASPMAAALLEESNKNRKACFDFLQSWDDDLSKDMQEF